MLFILAAGVASAEVKWTTDRNESESATAAFRFAKVPPPSKNDAATEAKFTLIAGRRDGNGGDVDKVHDGKVPFEEDDPSENFFFRAGSDGGRLLLDLGSLMDVQQVNTYSWHPSTRGPQVYTLYGSDGTAEGFDAQPGSDTEPERCGWKRIAQIDTRPDQGNGGGQYGVSIADSEGAIGRYRYLLFQISRTEDRDAFGNTFYSEIDVVDAKGPAPQPVEEPTDTPAREIVEAAGGKYQITIDTTETPDLTEWVQETLAPIVREWYPKLAEMLPSDGYDAPAKVSVVFSRSMRGVAATSGTRIRCSASWIRRTLRGEAAGSIVHELVHVVQSYGRGRRANPNAVRAPGWLTEGIADYIRWYLYEPQSQGAEITPNNLSRARFDASYRISANFLNWVIETKDRDLLKKMNAAIRDGRYSETLWEEYTGRAVDALGEEWKQSLEKKLAAEPPVTDQ